MSDRPNLKLLFDILNKLHQDFYDEPGFFATISDLEASLLQISGASAFAIFTKNFVFDYIQNDFESVTPLPPSVKRNAVLEGSFRQSHSFVLDATDILHMNFDYYRNDEIPKAMQNFFVPGRKFFAGKSSFLFHYDSAQKIDNDRREMCEMLVKEILFHLNQARGGGSKENAFHTSHRILENLPEIALVMDRNGMILLANKAFSNRFHYSTDEAESRNINKLITPATHYTQTDELIENVLYQGQHELRSTQHTKEGNVFPVLLRASIVDFFSEKHILLIIHDISEQIKKEENLMRAIQHSEDSNRDKRDFLANVSHEIFTPIKGILGMTELAKDSCIKPDQQEYLRSIENSADSLLALVQRVLDHSRLKDESQQLQNERFHFHNEMGAIIKRLAIGAHQKRLEIVLDIDPNIPEYVIGDKLQIGQILVNIVGNAIKFTDEGEVLVEILLKTITFKNIGLEFIVQDTGIGIPVADQESIFQSFVQGKSGDRHYGGTGLGLSISQEIVCRMEGKIWVVSPLPKDIRNKLNLVNSGTQLHFTLKLGHKSDIFTIEESEKQLSFSAMKNLMVVDDNQTNRLLIEKYAVQKHHMSIQAESVLQARRLEKVMEKRHTKFSAVLIDTDMPGEQPFRFAQDLYGNPDFTDSQIVFMTTASHLRETLQIAEKLNADFLLKPVLLQDLEKVLMGKSAQQQSGMMDDEENYDAKYSILLAEDNLLNRKHAANIFEKHGHHVSLAENGSEALERFKSAKIKEFDFVVLDLHMPLMDGNSVAEQIRRWELQHNQSTTAIFAMSAHDGAYFHDQFRDSAFDGFLEKPLDYYAAMAEFNRFQQTKDTSKKTERVNFSAQEALQNVEGDFELFEELFDIFKSDVPQILADLAQAVEKKEFYHVNRLAHTLKGVMVSFAASALAQDCVALQDMAKANQTGGMQDEFRDLMGNVLKLEDEIEEFLKEQV